MTEEQREHLIILTKKLRTVASSFGSLHSWWDIISDIEALLDEKKPLVKMTVEELIEYSEKLLEDKNWNRK